MGQFSLEEIPGGGYYLRNKETGMRLKRQQRDEKLVDFVVDSANFDPDFFGVLDADDRHVQAKFLKYNGEYIFDQNGNPYMVPYNFDFDNFIREFQEHNKVYKSLLGKGMVYDAEIYRTSAMLNFYPEAKYDLQRAYTGDSFTISFTSSASFVYGVGGSILGKSEKELIEAGGVLNWAQSLINTELNISGDVDNNPNNPPNIRRGISFYNIELNWQSSSYISTEKQNNNVSYNSAGQEDIYVTSNNFVQLSSKIGETFNYNLTQNVSPTSTIFNHSKISPYLMDLGYRIEINPNGINWIVNSAGKPPPYEMRKFDQQNRYLENTHNQTFIQFFPGNDDLNKGSNNQIGSQFFVKNNTSIIGQNLIETKDNQKFNQDFFKDININV